MLFSAVHRFATWLCLVAALLLGAAPARGLVLCVGADGHVALEASTADAECYDCPAETASEESCCADPELGDSDCNCTDTLLLASEKQPVRSLVTERIGELPAPNLLVKSESGVAAALLRPFELRARTEPPPCARVPALLVLRV
jgi:hypothetical protein